VLPSTLALSYLIGGTWVKQSIGLGTWTRNRHELLLFAVRGSFPAPAPRDRPDSDISVAERTLIWAKIAGPEGRRRTLSTRS